MPLLGLFRFFQVAAARMSPPAALETVGASAGRYEPHRNRIVALAGLLVASGVALALALAFLKACDPAHEIAVDETLMAALTLGAAACLFAASVRCLFIPQRAFDVAAKAIEAGAAARRVVVEAGRPEFRRGLGRAVHDGGTMLGPRWPCYGSMPERAAEADNLFTRELGVPTAAGFVGLEEDMLVAEGGSEILSSFQREPTVV